MILENMNSLEKLAQAKVISQILNERIDNFVDRNMKVLRKKMKKCEISTELSHEFSLGHHGKWDVQMLCVKLPAGYFKIIYTAYQKYFINYAKDPSNIGAGFYVIISDTEESNKTKDIFVEITPHCVNRVKERYPDMSDASLDVIKDRIVYEIGSSTREIDNNNALENDSNVHEAVIYTEGGQFYGPVSLDGRFSCLRTFVSNNILNRDQHAYMLALQKHEGKYKRSEIVEEADKLVKKMAKKGEDVHNLAEVKKNVLFTQLMDSMSRKIMDNLHRSKIDRILGID